MLTNPCLSGRFLCFQTDIPSLWAGLYYLKVEISIGLPWIHAPSLDDLVVNLFLILLEHAAHWCFSYDSARYHRHGSDFIQGYHWYNSIRCSGILLRNHDRVLGLSAPLVLPSPCNLSLSRRVLRSTMPEHVVWSCKHALCIHGRLSRVTHILVLSHGLWLY